MRTETRQAAEAYATALEAEDNDASADAAFDLDTYLQGEPLRDTDPALIALQASLADEGDLLEVAEHVRAALSL